MKQVWMFLIFFSIFLTGCGSNTPEITEESFCERNPEAVSCSTSKTSEEMVVEDLFTTVWNQLEEEPSATFCGDYFYGSDIIDDCTNDSSTFLPEDSSISVTDFMINDFTTDGVYEFITSDPDTGENYQFTIEVDSPNGFTQITSWQYTLLEDPEPVVLSIDTVRDMLQNMYDDYSAGNLVCSDYFTSTNGLLSECINDTMILFNETDVTDVTTDYYDVAHHVVRVYHNYGGTVGYTMLYPQYDATFVLVQNQIKMDTVQLYGVPNTSTVEALVQDFEDIAQSEFVTNESFCLAYTIDVSDCSAFRDTLANATTFNAVLETSDNGYGDLVYFLHITADQMTYTFELNIYTYDGTDYELGALWETE